MIIRPGEDGAAKIASDRASQDAPPREPPPYPAVSQVAAAKRYVSIPQTRQPIDGTITIDPAYAFPNRCSLPNKDTARDPIFSSRAGSARWTWSSTPPTRVGLL
ncbi:hypothetical protein BOTBODRAFT_192993 [Botryobasidium botryosum FD-172 SS1]|uniref:Uncharacterized protein n=1 Tax=Botryobasidium botryosum (strain FD-172 SS1) TaxID=930990 RepID=A0A067LTD9_BOTB1|nr:hypothetical protein BOTBODRAFT_192993 [Botryobasidium botryosum FD-172 SS1]